MKKITLKITALLCTVLFAFQAKAQTEHTEIVPGTQYLLYNAAANMYLRTTSGPAGTAGAVAEVMTMANFDINDYNLNWTMVESEYVQEGFEGQIYNVQSSVRGIMRFKGTKEAIVTAKQGPANDVDKVARVIYDAEAGGFRIYNRTASQVLTTADHPTEADPSRELKLVADATGGEDIWKLQVSPIQEPVASTKEFGANAFVIANPIGDVLTVKGATADVREISVYSVLGSKVVSKSLENNSGDIELNVSNLSNGLYIVEMIGYKGERFTQKLVKN